MVVLRYELKESPVYKGDYQIVNNYTGNCADQNLKSLKKIRRKYKAYLTRKTQFFFSMMSSDQAKDLKSMMPVSKLHI